MTLLDRRRDPDDGESRTGTNTVLSEEGKPAAGTDGGLVARRVLAFLVDTVVLVAGFYGLARRRSASTLGRFAITGVLATVLGAVYHVLLEGRSGQTLGKRLSGIEVRLIDGTRPGFGAAARRTALRLVDWFPVAYLLGLASIVLSDGDRRIGDLIAGTVVTRTSADRENERN